MDQIETNMHKSICFPLACHYYLNFKQTSPKCYATDKGKICP